MVELKKKMKLQKGTKVQDLLEEEKLTQFKLLLLFTKMTPCTEYLNLGRKIQ